MFKKMTMGASTIGVDAQALSRTEVTHELSQRVSNEKRNSPPTELSLAQWKKVYESKTTMVPSTAKEHAMEPSE